MSIGSAAPLWFADYIGAVRRGLIVGGENPPYASPPVAFDGVLGNTPASTLAEVSFSGSTITRVDAASFLDEGWQPGMTATIAGSDSNDGTARVVASVTASTLVFTGAVLFTTEGPTPDVQLDGTAASGFAYYCGPQHLNDWTGANVCVLVPSTGAPGNGLQARRTATPRKALGGLDFSLDIHVWGGEPPSSVALRSGVWDDERYRAPGEILQNVLRVLFWIAKGFQSITAFDGWANETEKLRHGEALKATFTVSFAIFDYSDTMLPSGLILTGSGQPIIKAPGAT